MQNDFAAVLLALFVPWEKLPKLTNDSMSVCSDECDTNCNQSSHSGLHACAFIWSQVKPTLPQHVRDFARNVELLRKSKRDVEVDNAERKAAASAVAMQGDLDPFLDSFDDDTIDMDILGYMDTEGENGVVHPDSSMDDNSLCMAYHLIRARWRDQDRADATDIRALHHAWKEFPGLTLDNFMPIEVDASSGVREDISAQTLKHWSDLIKKANVSNTTSDSLDGTGVMENENTADNDDNDNGYDVIADNEYTSLEPVLSYTNLQSTDDPDFDGIADGTCLGPHPSAVDITDMITTVISLNAKQKRTVSMIFYHVLRCQKKTSINLEDQFLLHISGEGGVGNCKSRVIEAVKLGMKLLQRQDEAIVVAPTGNAASNVGGSTIHTSLDVAIGRSRKRGSSSRVKSVWTNKTMLVIDEVSSKLLDSIDKQCKVMKNLNSDSTAVFGGLHVVIALGDFHQFPGLPYRPRLCGKSKETPLKKEARSYGTCSRMLSY